MNEAPHFTPSFRNPHRAFRVPRIAHLVLSGIWAVLAAGFLLQRKWWLGAADGFVAIVWSFNALARSREPELRVTPEGLDLTNTRKSYRVSWEQIRSLELRGHLNQHVRIFCKDGREIPIDALSVGLMKEASPRLVAAVHELEGARAYYTSAAPSR